MGLGGSEAGVKMKFVPSWAIFEFLCLLTNKKVWFDTTFCNYSSYLFSALHYLKTTFPLAHQNKAIFSSAV